MPDEPKPGDAAASSPPASTPGEGASTPAAPVKPAAPPVAARPSPPAAPPGEGDASTPTAPVKPAARPVAARPRPKPKPKAPPEAPKGPADPPPPDDLAHPVFLAALQDALPDAIEHVSYWVGDWTVIVPATSLLEVVRFLKETDEASFDYCADITASDWPPREKRFDVIYCLYSTRHRHRVRVKVRAGETEPVPSVSGVWPAANWLERELWDMFGVNLTGHPDLRRILMPDGWQGYPQRKDYPLEGPGEYLLESPMEWLRLRNLPDEAEIE